MENTQQQEVALVSDIMRVGVITVSPDDSLEYAAGLFEKYNYDGFPVIDHSKKLVGIVTGYDMILQGSGMHLPTILNIMKQASVNKVDNKALDEHFKKLREVKIREVMNIDPLVVGPEAKVEDLAKEFSSKLFELGVFATPIVFPMVAKDKSRIRVIPSASHSKKDLDFGINMFEKVGRELKVI